MSKNQLNLNKYWKCEELVSKNTHNIKLIKRVAQENKKATLKQSLLLLEEITESTKIPTKGNKIAINNRWFVWKVILWTAYNYNARYTEVQKKTLSNLRSKILS